MPEQQKDYSGFDRMSTEMLEEILRGDFALSDAEESDMDAILYIMEVIAKRKRAAQGREYSDAEQAWISFNQNYRYNLETPWYENYDDNAGVIQSKIVTFPKETQKKKKRLLRRFMGIVAASIVVIGCTSLTANALGYNIWQIIAQWTTETFRFVSDESGTLTLSGDSTSSQYHSLQEALDAYGITEKVVPTWIPEEYHLTSVEVSLSPESNYFTASYQNQEDYIFVQINNTQNDNYSSFEKDDSEFEVFESNGIKYYIMSNYEYDTVVWVNGSNECSITASVSGDELKRMIESIYER